MNGGQQTVLVALGGGFIDGHIATALSKPDVRVRAIDIKLLDGRHQISGGVDAHLLATGGSPTSRGMTGTDRTRRSRSREPMRW